MKSALKKFDTDLDTSTLRNNLKTHDGPRKKLTGSAMAKVGAGMKSKVIEAAVYAVVVRLLPLSFCYKKRSMTRFAEFLVEAGRSVPVNTVVDIHDLLPSSTAVREGVQRLAKKEHDRFRDTELHQVLKVGGGVTSDGLKQNVHGEKYYDFTIHYFWLGKPDMLPRQRDIKLRSKVFFCTDTAAQRQ